MTDKSYNRALELFQFIIKVLFKESLSDIMCTDSFAKLKFILLFTVKLNDCLSLPVF